MTEQLNRMAHDIMAAVERAKAAGKDISVLETEPEDSSPRFTMDEWNKWAEAGKEHITSMISLKNC